MLPKPKSLLSIVAGSALFLCLLPLRAQISAQINAQIRAQINPEWTTAQKPFHIAGNLYYVGSRDLAAYLITTPAGNILINANLESSPPQIRAAVEALGFKWAGTRILLNSQAHYDHMAGAARIVRETHAKVMVMEGDSQLAETGDAHDFGGPDLLPYAPVHVDRILHDGDTVSLGGTVLTAHRTAGHTRGCTTWTMQVKEGAHTWNVVIAGGFAALDSYRLVDLPGHPASYPGILKDFKDGFALQRTLPCDIFLGAHGLYFNMQEKLTRVAAEGSSVWVDPGLYRQVLDDSEKKIDARAEAERQQN
jgi:metallo-beta-lactamase class B